METEKIKVLSEMFNRLIDNSENKLKSSNLESERSKINIEVNIYKTFVSNLPINLNYIDLYELKDSTFNMYSNYLKMLNKAKEQNINNTEVLDNKIDNYESNYTAYLNIYNCIETFLNSVTLINNSYSNDIILKMMRYNNNQDESLLNEIFDLKERRRKISIIKYGEDILVSLTKLESLESRISRVHDNKADSYSLNKKEYRKSLLDTINAINDYYFLEYKNSKYFKKNDNITIEENNRINYNKLMNYINKYFNLINSVSKNKNIMLDVDNKKINTDNLLSYLCIYNIDSDYQVFKESLKNKKINNNDYIKEEYLKQVVYINKCIDYLLNYTLDRIKNDNILIIDTIKDKDDLVYERDELINTITNSERNDLSAFR